MGNEVDNKYSWVIKNFKSLKNTTVPSDEFSLGGCKWQLFAYTEGSYQVDHFSLFLDFHKHESLPRGWRKHANISFTVVNQISEKLSQRNEKEMWFSENEDSCGFPFMLHLSKLHEDEGFLVNGELKILVQIDFLQIIGKLNESKAASQPLKKVDQETAGELPSNSLNKTQQLQEGFEIHGFQLFPSQVESVKLIFESHPDIALEVRTKSQHLRKAYIGVLLGIIETLCQSPEVLTDDDLKEASAALSCLVNARFKVEWLEKKLHQVLEKKKTVKSIVLLLEVKEELLKLTKKTQNLNALLEKETTEVAAAKTPLSLSMTFFNVLVQFSETWECLDFRFYVTSLVSSGSDKGHYKFSKQSKVLGRRLSDKNTRHFGEKKNTKT